jgi:hypothetical protein
MRGMRFSMIAWTVEAGLQAIEASRRSNGMPENYKQRPGMHALQTETYSKLQPTPDGLLYHASNRSPRQFEVPLNRYSRLVLDRTALLEVDCRPEDLVKTYLRCGLAVKMSDSNHLNLRFTNLPIDLPNLQHVFDSRLDQGRLPASSCHRSVCKPH